MRTEILSNVTLSIREVGERSWPAGGFDSVRTGTDVSWDRSVVSGPEPCFDIVVCTFESVDASSDIVELGSEGVGCVGLDAASVVAFAVEAAWMAGFGSAA